MFNWSLFQQLFILTLVVSLGPVIIFVLYFRLGKK